MLALGVHCRTAPRKLRMTAHQENLNRLHAHVAEVQEQYAQGLITIREFFNAMLGMYDAVTALDLAGLVDPATGLTYPTQAELDAIDESIASMGSTQ